MFQKDDTRLTVGLEVALFPLTPSISLSASDAQPALLPSHTAPQLPQIHHTVSQLPRLHFPHRTVASLTSSQLVNTLCNQHIDTTPAQTILTPPPPQAVGDLRLLFLDWRRRSCSLRAFTPDTVIPRRCPQPTQTQRHSPFKFKQASRTRRDHRGAESHTHSRKSEKRSDWTQQSDTHLPSTSPIS